MMRFEEDLRYLLEFDADVRDEDELMYVDLKGGFYLHKEALRQLVGAFRWNEKCLKRLEQSEC